MKKRTAVLVALAVLLAGGGAHLLIRSTEAPDGGTEVKVPAKVAKAKAAKVVKAAAPKQEPKPDDGLMTGSIGSFTFSDTLSEEGTAQ